MKQNLGNVDRIVRSLIFLAVALLYVTGVISGTVAIVLGLIGVILLATSLVSFCPIYYALKLSTKKAEKVA